MTKTKRCGSCGEMKNINDFWVRSDNGKPRNTCKDCQKEKEIENNQSKNRKEVSKDGI